MSSVSDALSGSGGASGVNDQTFSDATLGDQITGGSGDIFGGSGTGGPTEFNSFSDIANALSGGGSTAPTAAQSFAMTPPAAAAATGGDPTGSASGTQSSTSPGQTPASSNQPSGGGGGGQNQQGDQQFAPTAAVQQLNKLLKQLQGKPAGPTGQVQASNPPPFALPTLAAGQTGAQSPPPAQFPNQGGIANLPGVAAGETGPQSPGGYLRDAVGSQPADARVPPNAASQPTAQAASQPTAGAPAVDAQGNPVTAAGTPASQTPTPPARPGDAGTQVAQGGDGRDITVRRPGGGAQPQPDLPTKTPLPTHKGGPEPAPAAQPPTDTHSNIPPPRLLQDIAGISTGNPTALLDLAKAAGILMPVLGMLMGGGRRGRHHFGGFQGMRGFRPFGARGGMGGGFRHPGGGMWPYHHPQFGWHLHHGPPGGGWLPMSPLDAQNMGITHPGTEDPNAPDPDRPPKETGADPGPASDQPSGAIPGVSGKAVDAYTREVANKYGVNPDVASRVLAQESSYGQARRPGDDGTSFGPFQLHFAPDGHAMGDEFMRDTGKDPRDPSTWKAQIDYAMLRASQGGWGPWTTTMKKLGMSQWTGITTNRRFAGQPVSNQQPPNVVRAAAIPPTLPTTSQPMVAGPG